MKWKVTNALSRDVEREQLNKILKDIEDSFSSLKLKQDTPVRPPSPPVVSRPPVTITLTGDVTGSATGTGQVTIDTELQLNLEGVEEAPNDGDVYWRGGEQWQPVPLALQVFSDISGQGLLVINPDGTITPTVVDAEVGEIDVLNGDGVDGDVFLSLADVENIGGGVLQKTEFDSKGRLIGSSEATTDDLEEGEGNLYFTDERAVDAVQLLLDEKLDYESLKTTLLAGANITLSPDDVSETITITATGGGGGGGGVDAVLPGAGIAVNSADPTMPVVGLSTASQAALDLATTALQPGDDVSELFNDAGYITESEATAAAPVQSVNTQTGDVVLTAEDVGAVEEAPEDGSLYGRQGGMWVEVPASGTGTVTSVDVSVPTGLSITGNPITAAGTLAFSWSSGYQGYTTDEASKLAGVQSGAQVNVATNLSQGTRTSTTVNVDSSTGDSATLNGATTTLAGVMSASDKSKLDQAITDAPNDTYPYARANQSWLRLTGEGSPYVLLSYPVFTDQTDRVITDQAGRVIVGNVPQIPAAWLTGVQKAVKDIYPLSALPPVTPYPREIYVSGTSGVSGIIPAYSDGSNWLRFSDNTAVN